MSKIWWLVFIWAGLVVFIQNKIKVGSMSWLLTCSSNITLNLPSYTDSALKRELNFCNCSILVCCIFDNDHEKTGLKKHYLRLFDIDDVGMWKESQDIINVLQHLVLSKLNRVWTLVNFEVKQKTFSKTSYRQILRGSCKSRVTG